MANYCTFAQIQASDPDGGLYSSTDAKYEAAITAMLPQASRLIDKEVGRWDNYFSPTTDDETRYFDGAGSDIELHIDEMVSLTSVSVAEEGGTSSSDYTDWTEDTDFFVWPYNHTAQGSPIRGLVVDLNGSKLSWTKYRKAVKVTGVFGYSATVPEDVNRACQIQVMRWYMRAKQGYQDAGAGGDFGQLIYAQSLDPDVREILKHYKVWTTATYP